MAKSSAAGKPRPPLGPGDSREPGKRRPRAATWLWTLLAAAALLWGFRSLFALRSGEVIPYAEFKQLVLAGRVREVVLGEHEIRGSYEPEREPEPELRDAHARPAAADTTAQAAEGEDELAAFHTYRVEDPGLIEELEQHGVQYTGAPPADFGSSVLAWVLPLALLFFVFSSLRGAASRAGTQLLGFGKSRAKLAPETGVGVTFDDVAGCDEAKQDLRQMVEFLKNPERFTRLGAHIPKGVLLLGPPGTGKTLIARAVAGEAGVPFFSLSGSDFVEMFVGVGAARVRDLFEQAKAKAPCIVFIDEIDAVGRQRGVALGGVNDEREQTLNQLLTEMDGFEPNSGVILIAATNRPEVLDRALLRPGRFDRQVVLDAPDVRGREAILRVHVRAKPLASDVDLAAIARATPGMSGADLANALNEAALRAAQRGSSAISQADIEDAIEKVVAGPERRSRRLVEKEKRRVAYHESGHALVAAFSESADPVQKISIVPRGRAALGYTLQLPVEEQYLRTQSELEQRIAVMLGGRAAESLVFGDVSTGAQDDLRQATAIARQMVCLFGMSERIGLATCARPDDGFLNQDPSWRADCAEETLREIDEEVRALLDRGFAHARRILEEHGPELEEVVAALLDKETLDRRSFEALVRRPGGAHAPAGV